MKEKRTRRPRRRSCCLGFGILLLALVICGGGAFAWLYEHPLSTPAIHQRVMQRLERITGLKVSYDSASLVLATGQYRIKNLRLSDPKDPGREVLKVGELLANIHPWEFLLNHESKLTSVVLRDPSTLDLVYTANSVQPGPRSEFLLDAVRKAQPPGSHYKGQLPFDEMKIENSRISLRESEGILPDVHGQPEALKIIGDMTIHNAGEDAVTVEFAGATMGANGMAADRMSTSSATASGSTVASGLRASVTFGTDHHIQVSGAADRLALYEIFRNWPQTWLRADAVKFDLSSSDVKTSKRVSAKLQAAGIILESPEENITVRDENLVLSADAEINTSAPANLLNLVSSSLESAGAHMQLAGTARYGRDIEPSVTAAFHADRMDEDYRAIIERLLPPGWDFDAGNEALGLDLHVSAVGNQVQNLNGTVQMHGVNLETPGLPAALKNLMGSVRFSDQKIELADVTGDYAGMRVALDGSFAGDLWKARSGDLNLNWSAIADLNKISRIHSQQINTGENRVSGTGKISGHGTWKQQIDLRKPEATSTPHIEGGFDFENVGITSSFLPAPVSQLTGKAIIDNDRLQVQNLTGTMHGSQMLVDGFMQGDKFFWRDPQVSATLTTRLDLAKLEDYLSADKHAQLEKYQLAGRAETRMLLNGPLASLAANFTGLMRLEDVGLSPNLDFMKGNISAVNGTLRWNGSSLSLENLKGQLNGEPLSIGGKIAANQVNLRVKTNASLESIGKTFPALSRFMEMQGGLTTDLEFSTGDKAASPPASIVEVLESARALLEQAVTQQKFALNGTLQLDNATMRHLAMPAARKENGRSIPAGRVTKMSGTVTVKNDTLTVSESAPITCDFSDTPRCKLSGTLKLRPNDMPQMQVKIAAGAPLKLDTWIMGWGKDLPHPSTPPMTGHSFTLRADIQAPSVILRGVQTGPGRGRVNFQMVQDKSPRITEFQDVVIRGGMPGTGQISGNGRIESFVWDPQNFPRWQTNVDVQAMPLEHMFGAVFVEPTNLRGMASGNLHLQGHGDDPRSIRGNGSATMRNLEIGRIAVMREVAQSTGRNFGGMQCESARAATFQIGNGAISSRDLTLQTSGLQLDMHGDYWFAADPARGIPAKTIDGTMRMRLFKSVFGAIPIIGQVADLADEVTNAFLLAFRVNGTADNPRVTPVPLPMFQGGT